MDFTENGESDALTNSRRQDLEELIALLADYKLKIESISREKSGEILSEEDAALDSLIKKMVLIKRKSFAESPTNGCSNNRLDEEDDSDTSNEDDASEKEGLIAVHPSTDSSEEIGSSNCADGDRIKLSDVEELISLLNDSLDVDDSKDALDFSQPKPCSKMERKATVIEKILMEKRNSSHCVVPIGCNGSKCRDDYIRDTHGYCRKVVTVVKAFRNPKKLAEKKK